MNYTLNQLRIFLKITQTKSITKAAEELNLTQPAISIQLKNFQDQFDIPLTEIIGRKIYITEFGMEISHLAENIINLAYDLNLKKNSFQGILGGRLKISTESIGKYILPYLMTDFIQINTNIELVLDVTNKNRVTSSLLENEVDFALVSEIPEGIQIESLPLFKNQLYFVCHQSLEINSIQELEEKLNHTFLLYREKGSGTREIMEEYFKKNKIKSSRYITLTSNEAIKQTILSGIGISLLPIIGIKNELEKGLLKIIPLTGFPIETEWNLIWMKGKKNSPAAAAYLSYLKKHKQELIKKNNF